MVWTNKKTPVLFKLYGEIWVVFTAFKND